MKCLILLEKILNIIYVYIYIEFFFYFFSFPLSDRDISGRILLYVCLGNFFFSIVFV